MTVSFNQGFTFLVLFISVGLMNVALPRFWSAFNYLPIDTAVERYNIKQVLAREKIPHLIEVGRESIDLFDNAGYWNDISELKLYQIQSEKIPGNGHQESLTKVQHYIHQSLSRSPANSYLWYRLAMVLSLKQGTDAEIVAALMMSIMTGPFEPGFMLERLRLCFLKFSAFKGEDRDLLISQVELAWNTEPKDFLRHIANERKNRIFLVLLLKDYHPEVLDDMVFSFENID